MEKKFVDFAAVKRAASIQSVLNRYNITLRKVNQDSVRGKCPLPTHVSEKSVESFSAHLGKNIWACQSSSCALARGGKQGGNVIDFVAVMDNCSIRDAALKLQEWFGSSSDSRPSKTGSSTGVTNQLVTEEKMEQPATEEKPVAIKVNKPLTFELKGIDHAHPYLRERGITIETAREFGVGFFPGKGSMQGRVVIPIHDDNDQLVAYAGRAIDNTEPKYKFPAGFHKSLELFNLHRVGESDYVVVVEGFFDCAKVHQAGFPCVALMGSTLSSEQEEMIVRKFRRVVVMFDGDEAGRRATQECMTRLARHVFVKSIFLAEGQQPDSIPTEEILALLSTIPKTTP